ncbi:MAG: hypothetical protein EPO08_17370, partial [Rhodospirillaceae bacterium]
MILQFLIIELRLAGVGIDGVAAVADDEAGGVDAVGARQFGNVTHEFRRLQTLGDDDLAGRQMGDLGIAAPALERQDLALQALDQPLLP